MHNFAHVNWTRPYDKHIRRFEYNHWMDVDSSVNTTDLINYMYIIMLELMKGLLQLRFNRQSVMKCGLPTLTCKRLSGNILNIWRTSRHCPTICSYTENVNNTNVKTLWDLMLHIEKPLVSHKFTQTVCIYIDSTNLRVKTKSYACNRTNLYGTKSADSLLPDVYLMIQRVAGPHPCSYLGNQHPPHFQNSVKTALST